MPLRIIIDQDLPAHINKLTLSYTLFDITDMHRRTTGCKPTALRSETSMAEEMATKESTTGKAAETYYVPEQSKWPIVASVGLFLTMVGAGMMLNSMFAGDQNPMGHYVFSSGRW